jgi:hypothetical protein
VIDVLVKHFAHLHETDARDLAVWRGGRILAVMRKHASGRSEVVERAASDARQAPRDDETRAAQSARCRTGRWVIINPEYTPARQ